MRDSHSESLSLDSLLAQMRQPEIRIPAAITGTRAIHQPIRHIIPSGERNCPLHLIAWLIDFFMQEALPYGNAHYSPLLHWL